MNHASLFSGIGGFNLAAEWMGWYNVLSCEIDEFCNKVLAYHFPNSIHYYDIKTTDFTPHKGEIDILTGGFPCQPFSSAGKRRGTDDDRHLWPEMLRAIREIQPRWIVGENVFGFTNWSGGLVFREVLSDLENEGYEVQPFIIPACAVNSIHERNRTWVIAYSKSFRWEKISRQINIEKRNLQNKESSSLLLGSLLNLPIAKRIGVYEKGICTSNDGIPAGLDGITVSKLRNESIKAAGNAIVPHVAYAIFKAIEKYEQTKTEKQ